MFFNLIRLWVGKDLPVEHIFILPKNRPTNMKSIIRVYFRKWMIHPIRRKIAKYYIFVLQKFFRLKVIAITGSAGKTTTKDMIVRILGETSSVVYSHKNIDPVFNIPSSIFRCRFGTKYLVLEMGVEYKDEMNFYMWLVNPDISVITNIYPTHTLFFGDADGVFEEKRKIQDLQNHGFAVLNFSDKRLRKLSPKENVKQVFFGEGSDICATNIKLNSDTTIYKLKFKGKSYDIEIPQVGMHIVNDSLAAISVCNLLGVDIANSIKQLKNFESGEHRMNVISLKNGARLYDDSYNNNPEAAKMAIESFITAVGNKQKKVVVFGDMLELGNDEEKYHREIGKFIAKSNVDILILVGKAITWTYDEYHKLTKRTVYEVRSEAEAGVILEKYLNSKYSILVKGSRSIGLDKLIERIDTN